ncbi:hypothetical protein [Pseudomonas entomophila]|uniref:hypothetical protein n=1 Tax=Pseudomonas entomophila TaxID=312306 RepID=UPI003EBF2FAC
MSNHNLGRNRPITVQETIDLIEPVQDALSAITVSVIKIASALTMIEGSEFVRSRGEEAFENVDNIIEALNQYQKRVENITRGRKADHE